MKKITALITLIMLVIAFTVQPSFAESNSDKSTIEYLDDGSYYETVIEDSTSPWVVFEGWIHTYSTTTATKTKTTYYKNADGDVLWYVRVKGTFTYGDGTSKCTAVTPSAASQASSWKVSNISGSKSGNTASATATGKQYYDGSVIATKTKTVTLTCSSTGVFS
ncbi:MAG: hypothetical protein PUB87_06320 [Eubacteriaceae bacterium]|nr:hypothetical protein [Eubacteriaceae bacterium]